jgi:hypothetical protein
MFVHYDIDNPPRQGHSYQERWEGPDHGLLCCWLRGIEKAREDPELAQRAIDGELPPLAWKGGVAKALKSRAAKIGSLNYFATWKGLRRESLLMNVDEERILKCSRTKVTVRFTNDIEELLADVSAADEAP